MNNQQVIKRKTHIISRLIKRIASGLVDHVIKHVMLFIMANILAAILFTLYADIADAFTGIKSPNKIGGSLGLAPLFAIGGMGFTYIPHIILLLIIKGTYYLSNKIKSIPLWAYSLMGALNPCIIYYGSISDNDYAFALVFACIGTICGLVYGLIDKELSASASIQELREEEIKN